MNSKLNNGGSTATGVTPDGIIPHTYYDEGLDSSSCSSTPYVSAPSSPGRAPIGYFYSAPSSPMHFLRSSASFSSSAAGVISCSRDAAANPSSFEFDFGFSGPCDEADVDQPSGMSSADELFLNGQIRPMKLSSHLQRPQNLAPLIDVEEEEDEEEDEAVEIEMVRGRDLKKMRDRSLRRKARSLSPLRTDWNNDEDDDDKQHEEEEEQKNNNGTKIDNPSSSSSRSSSGGRNSKRWVFLKDFMRSKSDGSNAGSRHAARFWSSISFSKSSNSAQKQKPEKLHKAKLKEEFSQTVGGRRISDSGKARNAIGKRQSAHEAHYTAKRAQAEEMKRKTFLPYRQGLLGCLGFSSRGYGAMNGLARALNSVSSRFVSMETQSIPVSDSSSMQLENTTCSLSDSSTVDSLLEAAKLSELVKEINSNKSQVYSFILFILVTLV